MTSNPMTYAPDAPEIVQPGATWRAYFSENGPKRPISGLLPRTGRERLAAELLEQADYFEADGNPHAARLYETKARELLEAR